MKAPIARTSQSFMNICLLPALVSALVLFVPAAQAQIDPAQEPVPSLSDVMDPEARAFVVEMEFHGQNEVSLISVDVIDSIAPSRLGGSGAYQVRILNGEGSTIETFDWWNPQEVHTEDSMTWEPMALGTMVFPFSPRAVHLELIDPQLASPVLVVDLEDPARRYCEARPWEPRCREINIPGEDPNLLVTVFTDSELRRGEHLVLEVRVTNLGGGEAPGTTQTPDGYMVDLVLSTDSQLPDGFAEFEPGFMEDVLLEGGRLSDTETVPGGESRLYEVEVRLPEDTPPGIYCLGAFVDPGHTVYESVELDNTFCFQLTIDEP